MFCARHRRPSALITARTLPLAAVYANHATPVAASDLPLAENPERIEFHGDSSSRRNAGELTEIEENPFFMLRAMQIRSEFDSARNAEINSTSSAETGAFVEASTFVAFPRVLQLKES